MIRGISLLPLPVLYFLSAVLAPVLQHLVRYRKKTVEENLRNAFPEKPEAERARIERKYYRHLCDLFVEIAKSLHWSREKVMKRIVLRNESLLQDLSREGKPVLVAFGHYGNWEWMNAYNRLEEIPILPIYKDLSNKAFDDLFLRLRKKLGSHPVPMKQTYRAVSQFAAEGKHGIFCFLTDQCPVREELEYWTAFLNQDTPVFLGIERLARRFDLPVVFMAIRKRKRGRYEVEWTLITDQPRATRPFEITEAHLHKLEDLIRERPEYWMWSHRRWKFNREDMLRRKSLYLGKGIPGRPTNSGRNATFDPPIGMP